MSTNLTIIIANSNPIHQRWENKLKNKLGAIIIHDKDELDETLLKKINPNFIFFLHWSYIIPPKIYNKYNCIVFHMTDLPFGRGGSPLQNLIVRGLNQTKISALKVDKGIDTGDIYLKMPLSLYGTAEEIFLRAGELMYQMTLQIIKTNPSPIPQEGEITTFERRKPEDSDMSKLESLQDVYDYIRMLDAEGYPSAYLETEKFKLEFSRASLKKNHIIADVRIIKK